MSPRHARPERAASRRWHRIWEPFWVLPAVVALGSVVLGIALPQLDEEVSALTPSVFEGGPDGARQFLGTIASAMISVTGLVFSITMVVIQLASSQFTPRLLGTFLQSRIVQLTLGVFTGSFVYSLTVLRLVRDDSGLQNEFVPQVSVAFAFLYVLTAVAFFVAFIHHITQSVRVSQVITRVGRLTRHSAAALYAGQRTAATWSPAPGTPHRDIVCGDRRGLVTAIDSTGLTRWALKRDGVVELSLGLGTYVTDGDTIGRLWGAAASVNPGDARQFLDLDTERVLEDDFDYGIRQLTDIADRALSPGINDPTTACQVVDELYSILRPMVAEPNLSPYLVAEDGSVRAIYQVQTVADEVDTSLGEIARYAENAPRVLARIHTVTELLQQQAHPEHQAALAGLKESVEKALAAADRT